MDDIWYESLESFSFTFSSQSHKDELYALEKLSNALTKPREKSNLSNYFL